MPVSTIWSDRFLSVLRIAAALAFMHHGTSKLFGLPIFPMEGPLPPLLVAAALIELIGGGMILLGLFTRPVALVASGMSAVGYFMAHAPKGFFPSENGGEPILLYSLLCLYHAPAGGGAWGLDRLRGTA